jgi:hypothetical protein
MSSLPKYKPRDHDIFMEELARRKASHQFVPMLKGINGHVSKISFICACHGAIYAELVDSGLDIPDNGKYEETAIGPLFTGSIDPFVSNGTVPIYNKQVIYKTTKPILIFLHQNIDVREMNVTLSTTNTCLGAPIYRLDSSAIIKQKFVNDILENIPSMCPTNTLLETKGKYGETFHISHREYERNRQESAARKIQRLFTKNRKISPDFKTFKTRLMKYDREKVDWLLNKKYAVKTCDVATIKQPIPAKGNVEILPTECDAHKLIMIVTKYTEEGCESKKYILLGSSLEVKDEIEKIHEDFPESIGTYISNSIGEFPENLIMGRKHGNPSHELFLHDLLILGKKIIEEFNGIGAAREVPIDIHELSCNTYGPFTDKVEPLGKRDLFIIRIFDDYARKKTAYGVKRKSKKYRKRKPKIFT